MSELNQAASSPETTQTTTDSSRKRPGGCRVAADGEHHGACRSGGRGRRILAVILLIGVGVLIGRFSGHHEHHGPWAYGHYGPAWVSNGQSLPVGKLLDDIGASPEQRAKADAALKP